MKTDYQLILASASPRRKELLAGLNIPFEVRLIDEIDETYPSELPIDEVPLYISQKKAAAYKANVSPQTIVLTADTVVVCNEQILGKPINEADARRMLQMLSGKTHRVITGVTLLVEGNSKSFSVATDVTFKPLSAAEIDYYIRTFKPFDKAGAYGIQEWIGYIGVTAINGSYFNVMGLPVQRIYEELRTLGINIFLQ
ncbi:Maf-like protein [Hoylesella saccharolytica]|uniref:Maf-like protein n=1 Tax=Hoylesella saccharolytica TaxID=633701 RepID=UPI0028E953AC|nr:Maf-like protein [Hoylesella saccharolytica]